MKAKLLKLLLLSLWALLASTVALAECQRTPSGNRTSGSMGGFASGKPALSSAELTFSFPLWYSSSTTSGTSGCPRWHLVEHIEQSRRKFLLANQTNLREEAARGNGAYLNALGRLMGCSQADQTQFNRMVKQQLLEAEPPVSMVTDEQVERFVGGLNRGIQANTTLNQQCRWVG